jgi:cytochrome c553
MKNSLFAFICSLIVLSFTQMNAQAADIKAGKVAFETCRGCHSSPGYSNVYPTFYVPKVGGQRAGYIAEALKAYKLKSRPHGTMKANSYDLSEQKIENIAAYVESATAKKRSAAAKGSAKKGKQLAASCEGCHTNKLNDGATAPILAGQYGNYLVKAMKDYQIGKRNNPVMQSMLNGLSDDDLHDISAYFAGMQALTAVK